VGRLRGERLSQVIDFDTAFQRIKQTTLQDATSL
jgi:hypothetical protein